MNNESENICPNCHRPINDGNSPNKHECHGDDVDGVCEAYAEVFQWKQCAEELAECLSNVDDLTAFEKQSLSKFNQLKGKSIG